MSVIFLENNRCYDGHQEPSPSLKSVWWTATKKGSKRLTVKTRSDP
jgi:hypothetical protein